MRDFVLAQPCRNITTRSSGISQSFLIMNMLRRQRSKIPFVQLIRQRRVSMDLARASYVNPSFLAFSLDKERGPHILAFLLGRELTHMVQCP